MTILRLTTESRRRLRRASALLLDLIVPTRCFCCQERLGPHQALGACLSCWALLNPHRLRRSGPFDAAVAYDEIGRAFLKRAKFQGRRELFDPLGAMLVPLLRGEPEFPDCLIPVPSHPWNTLRRGYSPAHELVHAIRRRTGIPVVCALKRRFARWTDLKGLGRKARESYAEGLFSARSRLDGRSVLIVDDLVTTGTTLTSCAAECTLAGAKRVSGLAWARVQENNNCIY